MASLDDILTTAKNIVTAVNNVAQTYLSVQGAKVVQAISVPTVVSTSPGRAARASVTVAGSTPGLVYDSAALTMLSRPIYSIPNTLGDEEINLPVAYGVVVVPGAGQTVTVSYSAAAS